MTSNPRPLVLIDVGCRWGIPERWAELGEGGLRVYAFDADAAECARLQPTAPAGVTYVPQALYDHDGSARLHVAREPGCSSLFPPDPSVLARFPGLIVMEQIGETQVEVRTLDGWARTAGVSYADVLKLDAQGAELGVLQGATELLASVRTIETEVMFNPMYTGQPLFGDIDAFLRARGFRLWRLKHLVHYSGEPETNGPREHDRQFFDDRLVEFPVDAGQVTWGHAYYCAERLATRDWTNRPCALRDASAAELVGLDDLAAAARAWAGSAGA